MQRWLASAARGLPWCAIVLVSGCASLQRPVGSLPGQSVPSLLLNPGVALTHTIVVDAGHGGHDPGTMHHGLREKDLALDIAHRLEAELRTHELSVTMTREGDEFIPLSRRPNVANRIPADVFVSVHINANRNRHVSGVEVYYPRDSVVDTDASFPPHIAPQEVALPTTAIKRILWDMVLSQSRRQSARMALHMCRALRSRLGVRCRGVKGARFVVLREAKMPAVLVEVGYLSNRPEASRLASPAYRQAIAQAIAEGVLAHVQELEAQRL